MGWSRWAAAAEKVLQVVFPGRCLLCGEWLLPGDSSPVCGDCGRTLTPLGNPRCAKCGIELISEKCTCLRCRAADFSFDFNVSLFPYSGPARSLIAEMKFNRRRRLAAFFAAHVSRALEEHGLHGAVLVPAPPRKGRREPDAVARVARALRRNHGVRVVPMLRRAGGAQQKSLGYEQRKANLRGMISLAPTRLPQVMPPEVVLLDDVFTTGATLDACARVLREAGCAAVKAITLVIEE
jgi:ComF family protein